MILTKKKYSALIGLSLFSILFGCSQPDSSSYEPSHTSPSDSYTPAPALSHSNNGYSQATQQAQPSSSTDTLDRANQDLHREEIQLERDQLESRRYAIEQESIINNYGTFCPSTGPCD